MSKINLADSLNERLIQLDSKMGAALEQGHNFDLSDGDDKKKDSMKKVGRDVAIAGGVTGAAAGAAYLHGRRVSGGNAKGVDAMQIGARDVTNRVGDKLNDARFHGAYHAGAVKDAVKGVVKKAGMKTGGFLSKAGKAISKVAKRFDTLERMTLLGQNLDSVINFETIDDATARKPVQKDKSPKKTALVGVGMGTVGAAAGYAGGMHHAQIVKAGHRGMSMAKKGYKAGTSQMAKAGKGIMGEIGTTVAKFRRK